MKRVLLAILIVFSGLNSHSQNWLTAGNSGTGYFNSVGTTDNKSLRFRTNNTLYAILDSNGKFGIGIAAPAYNLDVTGNSRITSLLQIGSSTSYPANTVFSANGGVSMMHFSQGLSSLTPSLSIYNTNASAKGFSFIAGTSGSAFVFDSSGWFGMGPEQKSNITGGVSSGNRLLYKMFQNGQSLFSTSSLTSVSALSSNVAILNTNNGYTGLLIRGSASQSADLLQLQNNSGSILARITATGKGRFQGAEFSGYINSFQLTDSSFTPKKYVDSLSVVQNQSGWKLAGNAGINPATTFIGTTDNQPLVFKANNTEAFRITETGSLIAGLGSPTPNAVIRFSQGDSTQRLYLGKNGESAAINLYGTDVGDGADNRGGGDFAMNYSKNANAAFRVYTTNNTLWTKRLGITQGGFDVNILDSFSVGVTSGVYKLRNLASTIDTAFKLTVFNPVTKELKYVNSWQNTPGSPNNWSLAGNTGINASSAFIGTTDNQPVIFKSNNTETMRIGANGNIGIGTSGISDTAFRLFVEKGIHARKVKVDLAVWADYVFDNAYKLPSLNEVQEYINQHKHLPDMPSATEVGKNGIDLGENQALLLKKIEELTLYAIEQNKQIETQNRILEQQQRQIDQLLKLVEKK